MTEDQVRGVRVDWTLNVGNLLTIVVLIVSTVVALRSYERKLDATLAAFDKRIEMQQAAFDKRLALLEQLAVEYIPELKQTRKDVLELRARN